MRAGRKNDKLVLRFGSFEKQLLLHTVEAILQNYKLKPHEIDPNTAAVWYSTRGCKTAGMSVDETREWVENLYNLKSANAHLLQQWCQQIKEIEPGKFELTVKLDQAASLVTIINDHRLHLAAKHEIGQDEMDLRSLAGTAQLAPEQQSAVLQIDLLGWLIEVILRLTSPEAASWSDVLESPDEPA